MEWIILITVILLIFIYLLFAPFFLEIDSTIGLFRIRFYGLASGKLVVRDNSPIIDLNVLGWHKMIDLFKTFPHKKAVRKKRIKKKRKIQLKKILEVIKSFSITRFRLVIDTGNLQLNGILFPEFYWISRLSGKTFRISFLDENEIVLEIKNNFARIIWAYIKS